MNPQLIQDFLRTESLPQSYGEDAEKWFLPLAQNLIDRCNACKAPLFVGVNGAQGTGKTTLSKLLSQYCEQAGLKVVVLSIDDFYLSHAARAKLAGDVHPLLASRGVPGTHDIPLLHGCLDQLLSTDEGEAVPIPRFDKATDNPVPASAWTVAQPPVDLVMLEGWFIGVAPEPEDSLTEPVNELETQSDPDGGWRRFVNESLAASYSPLFARMDLLVMLQAPSFEQVYAWRGLQEQKLKQSKQQAAASEQEMQGIMDREQLNRFIQHFERLTRHCLATLPARADLVFRLDANHRVVDQLDKSDKS